MIDQVRHRVTFRATVEDVHEQADGTMDVKIRVHPKGLVDEGMLRDLKQGKMQATFRVDFP